MDRYPNCNFSVHRSISLPVLFDQQKIPEGEVNIKVTGYQWYWGYEYVDEGFEFESFLIGVNLF
jgi:cytochrome c oxidase subunit 2